MKAIPSYLVKRSNGVYYFQYRIPNRFGLIQKFIKKSLNTRNFSEAVKLARQWIFIVENVLKKYFEDPERLKIALEVAKRSFNSPDQLNSALSTYTQFNTINTMEWEYAETEIDKKFGDNVGTARKINEMLSMAQKFFSEVNNLQSQNQHQTVIYQNSPEIEAKAIIPLEKDNKDDPLLNDAFEWFISANKGVSVSTIKGYQQGYNFFSKIIIDNNDKKIPRLSEISSDMVRTYKKALIDKRLKPNSITMKFSTVRTFLDWCDNDQGFLINENLIGILKFKKKHLPPVKPKAKDAKILKPNELKTIFETDYYKDGIFTDRKGDAQWSGNYWMWLIGLYSGMRFTEIAQLRLSQIFKDDNTSLWCFNIQWLNEKERLKNEASNRIIPIHPELKTLGLIKYRNELEKMGFIRLFPDERFNKTHNYSALNMRIFRYFRRIGLREVGDDGDQCFHSFRHTVATKLLKETPKKDHDFVSEYLGHDTSKAQTETKETYDHNIEHHIKEKSNVLKKLSYDIELSNIKKWDNCNFMKKIRRDQEQIIKVEMTPSN